MMKKLILLLSIATPIATPMMAFAHPGHGIQEMSHGFLHGEHLLILLAVALAIGINKIISK